MATNQNRVLILQLVSPDTYSSLGRVDFTSGIAATNPSRRNLGLSGTLDAECLRTERPRRFRGISSQELIDLSHQEKSCTMDRNAKVLPYPSPSVVASFPCEPQLFSKHPLAAGDRSNARPVRFGLLSRPVSQVATIRGVRCLSCSRGCRRSLDISPLGLHIGSGSVRLLVIPGRSAVCENSGGR